jgi:hypothetical protein
VTIAAAVAGASTFAVGLLWTFAGSAVRPRIAGLTAMGAGALVVQGATSPTRAGAWWMAVIGGLTLAGLVYFALTLERWARRAGDSRPVLDDPAE